MRDIQGIAPYADIVDAPSPEDLDKTVRLGIRSETFRQYRIRGLATAIAQYYGIVQNGIIHAQHLFQGLRRPLMLAEDMKADESVLVYTWRSSVDFEWCGSPQNGWPEEMHPPAGRVFAVLVRQEELNACGVFGSIEKWNWIKEDPQLPGAPIGRADRYSRTIWSR